MVLLLLGLLWIGAFVCLYMVFSLVPIRIGRWRSRKIGLKSRNLLLYRALSTILVMLAGQKKLAEKARLLQECGIRIDVQPYEATRKGLIASGGFLLAGGIAYPAFAEKWFGLNGFFVSIGIVAALIPLIFDRLMLEFWRKQREYRIVREIHAVSNQLLYYCGLPINLHTKLTRCLPLAKTIRGEMQTMLNEWYHDGEAAIRRFQRSLGTEDGYGFAETLNSLRLDENESYYALLRERIHDYKEKMELSKESRKETTSYLLFTLAGVPILYTFRLFIYPWVIEGQRLFESLN